MNFTVCVRKSACYDSTHDFVVGTLHRKISQFASDFKLSLTRHWANALSLYCLIKIEAHYRQSSDLLLQWRSEQHFCLSQAEHCRLCFPKSDNSSKGTKLIITGWQRIKPSLQVDAPRHLLD